MPRMKPFFEKAYDGDLPPATVIPEPDLYFFDREADIKYGRGTNYSAPTESKGDRILSNPISILHILSRRSSASDSKREACRAAEDSGF